MTGFKFERSNMNKDEWLTPPEILNKLGAFDLDPCSPISRPWDTAKLHYNINDLGLQKQWNGRIWLNPPYGDQTKLWLEKMSLHNNGIALIFTRTDTPYFHEYIFERSTALLFIKRRLRFYHVDGNIAEKFAGAPSVLVAFNNTNADILKKSQIKGKFISL